MTKVLTIANGTAANTVTRDTFDPDRDFKFIVGFRAFIGGVGSVQGGNHVLLAISDSKGDIIQDSHSDGWIPDKSVPLDERWFTFKKGGIPIDGSLLKLAVTNPVLSTGEYEVRFEFLLADDLVKFANVN